jgi:hypothetical protein
VRIERRSADDTVKAPPRGRGKPRLNLGGMMQSRPLSGCSRCVHRSARIEHPTRRSRPRRSVREVDPIARGRGLASWAQQFHPSRVSRTHPLRRDSLGRSR